MRTSSIKIKHAKTIWRFSIKKIWRKPLNQIQLKVIFAIVKFFELHFYGFTNQLLIDTKEHINVKNAMNWFGSLKLAFLKDLKYFRVINIKNRRSRHRNHTLHSVWLETSPNITVFFCSCCSKTSCQYTEGKVRYLLRWGHALSGTLWYWS